MGFGQGISGLAAAQRSIDASSNNVANAGTIGFKKSRAEFGDIFASTFYGVGNTSVGQGSQVMSVTQDFQSGNLNNTGRSMDLAIDGRGFFTLSGPQGIFYSRNGQFQIDKNGFIVNSAGLNLMGAEVRENVTLNIDGSTTKSYSPVNNSPTLRLKVDTTEIKAKASDLEPMRLNVHLDSTERSPLEKLVDPPGTILMRARLTKADGTDAVDGEDKEKSVLILKVPKANGDPEFYALPPRKEAEAAEGEVNNKEKLPGQISGYYVKVDYDEVTKTAKLPPKFSDDSEITLGDDGFTGFKSADQVLGQRVTYINEMGQLVIYNPKLKLEGATLGDPEVSDDGVAHINGVLNVNDDKSVNKEIAYSKEDLKRLGVAFDPKDPSTYNNQVTQRVYDSLGQELFMTQYFVRIPTVTANKLSAPTNGDGSGMWKVYTYVQDPSTKQTSLIRPRGIPNSDGSPTDPSEAFFVAKYKEDGELDKIFVRKQQPPKEASEESPPYGSEVPFLDSEAVTTLDELGDKIVEFEGYSNVKPERAAEELNLKLKLEGTQSFGKFTVNNFVQSGYPTGNFNGMEFNEDGVAIVRYTNGQTKAIGIMLLSTFNNEQGLANRGGNLWAETTASGSPLTNKPNSSITGAIRTSTLEASNVNLTAELVDMIQSQAVYQANAQSIRTQNTALQSVLNIT